MRLRAPMVVSLVVIACVVAAGYASNVTTNTGSSTTKTGVVVNASQARAMLVEHKTPDPILAWRLQTKLAHWDLQAQGKSEDEIKAQTQELLPPPPDWRGGPPTKGTVKLPVFLVEFPDAPHDPLNQKVSDIRSKMFGDGDSSYYPYESLRNYYWRSSYHQLTITGDVLGWYMARHDRGYYEAMDRENRSGGLGQQALMEEVIEYYHARGVDFSQYDNNNDEIVDGIYIKWTGPVGGWDSFWWPMQWEWRTDFVVDGLLFYKFIWSSYKPADASPYAPPTYQPRVDIHETGHLLGLPDYYDYKEGVGPEGGVGCLDMMDASWGDHNCFSKLLLDWITPQVISSGSRAITLNPSGTSPDAVIIMPSTKSNTYGEFFMVQYRVRGTGNDPGEGSPRQWRIPGPYPADGLLIWHVDATLDTDGTNFLYDNSRTNHKLLRLMEADGREHIENGNGKNIVTADDFYVPPKTFGPSTTPNSDSYQKRITGVVVDSLTLKQGVMTGDFTINITS